MDGFPVPNSDGLVLTGLAVCWGSRDAYYVSLQQEQSEGKHMFDGEKKLKHHGLSSGDPLHSLPRPPGLSTSLAPPPLDDDLPVSERLSQVKTCLGRPAAGRESVVVTYDIIRVYKTLVLSCGIGLEGNYEDPKV